MGAGELPQRGGVGRKHDFLEGGLEQVVALRAAVDGMFVHIPGGPNGIRDAHCKINKEQPPISFGDP